VAMAPLPGLEANGGPVLGTSNGVGAICNSWSWILGFDARDMGAAQVGREVRGRSPTQSPMRGIQTRPAPNRAYVNAPVPTVRLLRPGLTTSARELSRGSAILPCAHVARARSAHETQ